MPLHELSKLESVDAPVAIRIGEVRDVARVQIRRQPLRLHGVELLSRDYAVTRGVDFSKEVVESEAVIYGLRARLRERAWNKADNAAQHVHEHARHSSDFACKSHFLYTFYISTFIYGEEWTALPPATSTRPSIYGFI